MNRASPAELRKALEIAATYAKAGIDFVCVPVLSEGDKIALVNDSALRVEQLLEQTESEAANDCA